jgi:phosphinothricin acetyltransferase
MLIRAAVADDFDAIAALTNHYIERTAIHFSYEAIPAAEVRRDWEASREKYPFLVVEVDGQFAGYAKAYLWRGRAAYSRTAETGIYIEPRFQGAGVGKGLYRALIEACRAAGFHTLVAGIAVPNENSCRLHEVLGFVQVGVFHEVGRKFDRWHDVAFYELVLEVP